MPELRCCTSCGIALSGDALHGLCPECAQKSPSSGESSNCSEAETSVLPTINFEFDAGNFTDSFRFDARLKLWVFRVRLWVRNRSGSAMQSAAPVETLERRGFQQELGKVSMKNSRLSHTLHSADGGYLDQMLCWRAFKSVLGIVFLEIHPLQTRKTQNFLNSL